MQELAFIISYSVTWITHGWTRKIVVSYPALLSKTSLGILDLKFKIIQKKTAKKDWGNPQRTKVLEIYLKDQNIL